ncbi:Replication protein A DNA-binding subunit A [Glycine soja]
MKAMSGKENLISELHPRKGSWKIAVRITDMWDVKKHNGRQAIEMVFIDQMGVKIRATLWQELFPEFQPKLSLGCSYLIQNIKVVDNQSEYKVSSIPYLLYFVKTTSVKEVERPEILANVHVITKIADIISGIALRHTLVDVVGVIAEVIERKTVNPAYRVTVKLRDNSDAEILMTLWEDYALQLDDVIEKNHFKREPLVLMLTLAKIKDATDKYPLSVQNIKNGSKLYVNSDDIAEIRKFRDSLCVPFYVGGLTEEDSGSQSQYTSNSQRGDRDKFLHNAQMVRLGDISRLREDCFCLTVATVDEVLIDTPWSYDSCPNCTTTFDPLKIVGACRSCQNQVSHTVPKYKLVVKMEHNGEKANFYFWDATCIKMFDKTAEECRQELIVGGDEIKVFPECVDDLVGKTLAVRFKFRVNMRQSSVMDVSEEEHHIQTLTFKLGLQPSLSQSADYDPGNTAFITLAKRLSGEQATNEFDSEDTTAYELSTNKHIKAEYIVIVVLYTCVISEVDKPGSASGPMTALVRYIVDKPLYDSGLMTPYDGNVYTYTKSLSYKVLELVPKQGPPKFLGCTVIYQFQTAFHVDRNYIEVPSKYHQQWAPDYPPNVLFDYNGHKQIIQIRKDNNRYYFADGLKLFRRELNIYEGVMVYFMAPNNNTTFHLHFTPPLERQTCGRSHSSTKNYVFTIDITQPMISNATPLDDAENDKNGNLDTPYENQNTGYKDVGDPIWQCRHCKAMMWYDERINKDKQTKNPKFALYCGDGKIQLPVLEDVPQPLRQLLFDSNDSQAKNFQQNIRSYNVMFAFTSPGLQLDTRYNTVRGPPTFRVHGQGHHLIGSLLPLANKSPKFAQLYIYDTDNEVNNRLLQNPMARDKLQSLIVSDLKLKLIYDRQSDGRLYNLPNTAEVVALIVGDEHTGNHRDIIIEKQTGLLKRINELHPAYLPLQYPLLYPRGEDGYRPDIPHKDHPNIHAAKRKNVTMREYFCYRLQSRNNEAQTRLHSRRLFQQWIVDGYCMIESQKLNYVTQHQQQLRVDKYINLNVCNNAPETLGNEKGQRYMEQLYFDGMTICGHIGFPDLFLTLTCNLVWPEIQRKVRKSNLTPHDCPGVVSRIFKMKLNQLMNDLKRGHVFGPILGCIQLTDKETMHLCLTQIENMLQANRKSYAANPHQNKLIYNEMAYDKEVLATEFNRCYHSMIDKQASIFDNIMCVVASQLGGVYFLYGYGGTGKTFMWKTLSSAVRSNGGIVLTVASSGIASLLLPGGRTTHSKFAIPVLATQNSTCNIHQESDLAELLQRTKLIIWDEAPMCHKFSFEALDKSLKDIMYNDRPFGGKVIVFGSRSDIVHFPFIVSFAMTINKSQGQSLAHVGLYLPNPEYEPGRRYRQNTTFSSRLFLFSVSASSSRLCLSLQPYHHCALAILKNNSNLQHSEIKEIVAGSASEGFSIPACVTTTGTSLIIRQMTTPPSSPPPPPSDTASHSPFTLKRTRKATYLRSLATRVVGVERPLVHVDPETENADGPHRKKLRTYLGIVARDNVDVTYENLKQVPTAQKDLIWEDIQAEFDIPEASNLRKKKKILQISQFQSQMQSEGLALPPEPEVGPSAARVNTKESCVDPSRNDPYMSDLEKCGLKSSPPGCPMRGRQPFTTSIWAMIKSRLVLRKLEMQMLTFLYPLKRAVGLTKPIDRPDHDADDPLYLMTLTIPQLFLKSLQVMWDATMFVVFNDNFPLYIKHEDMSEITHGGQCLSISVIQLWILHMTEISLRAGNADVYGFLEPRSIQRSVQSQFESESYIKNWMQNSKRGVYLGAYLNGALKEFDDTPQSKSKVAARWIAVRYFNDAKPLKLERLKALRIQPNGCPVQAYSEKFNSTIPGEFEDLANWIIGLPPSFLLSCFISVLAPEIRSEPPLVIKRLTSDEIASHHEHDLCLNCDERYHRGHHYASRVFLFITEDEDTSGPNIESADSSTDPPKPPDPHPAQISLNSLTGHLAPEALRLVGLIIDHSVVLLLDGGSTHNFAQHQLVAQLGLPCRATSPLRVMVGNDQNLECTTISFNKFFSIVPLYGTIMATYKLQSIAFALCSTAKPSAICRNRPWDPDITLVAMV